MSIKKIVNDVDHNNCIMLDSDSASSSLEDGEVRTSDEKDGSDSDDCLIVEKATVVVDLLEDDDSGSDSDVQITGTETQHLGFEPMPPMLLQQNKRKSASSNTPLSKMRRERGAMKINPYHRTPAADAVTTVADLPIASIDLSDIVIEDRSPTFENLLKSALRRKRGKPSPKAFLSRRAKRRLMQSAKSTRFNRIGQQATDHDSSLIFVSESKADDSTSLSEHNNVRLIPQMAASPHASWFPSVIAAPVVEAVSSDVIDLESTLIDVPTVKIKQKRKVIIDGSNVAYAHGKKDFSVKGIEICLNYFTKLGHDAIAAVPLFRKNKFKSTDPNRLEELNLEGKIMFTPCKNIQGSVSVAYDDRLILQAAKMMDAVVVSNDNYNDLINEDPDFKTIIESSVLGYTFFGDQLLIPNDPYGRNGPKLHEILHRES